MIQLTQNTPHEFQALINDHSMTYPYSLYIVWLDNVMSREKLLKIFSYMNFCIAFKNNSAFLIDLKTKQVKDLRIRDCTVLDIFHLTAEKLVFITILFRSQTITAYNCDNLAIQFKIVLSTSFHIKTKQNKYEKNYNLFRMITDNADPNCFHYLDLEDGHHFTLNKDDCHMRKLH